MTKENDANVNPEMDWVTQDVVPARAGIDERRFTGEDGRVYGWGEVKTCYSAGLMHGQVFNREKVEVRCRRRDYPVVQATPDVRPNPEQCMTTEFTTQPAPARTKSEWTFGTPAIKGHYLISRMDPALNYDEVFCCTFTEKEIIFGTFWFVYLGQTDDFVQKPKPKKTFKLMVHPTRPTSMWVCGKSEQQRKFDEGWKEIKEQDFEVTEAGKKSKSRTSR